MKKNDKNLILLFTIFSTMLVISNIIASKVIYLPLKLFGENILLPSAVICYPITYLITDIIGEIWGKKEADQAVKLGFIAQCSVTLIIFLAQFLPALDPKVQEAYNILLGQNIIFVIGSFASYLTSQFIDVKIFHSIRNKWIKKYGNKELEKGKWIWNNLSTLTSQIVDTVIYITIAFGIGFGWLFTNIKALCIMIISQYLCKAIIALLDTPFFYFFTRKEEE